jgi:carbon storage regulator
MLVLSRKTNESVMVDDCLEVVVLEVRGDKVRLGFKASPDLPIHRREIYDQIQKGKKRDGNP